MVARAETSYCLVGSKGLCYNEIWNLRMNCIELPCLNQKYFAILTIPPWPPCQQVRNKAFGCSPPTRPTSFSRPAGNLQWKMPNRLMSVPMSRWFAKFDTHDTFYASFSHLLLMYYCIICMYVCEAFAEFDSYICTRVWVRKMDLLISPKHVNAMFVWGRNTLLAEG